MQQEPQSMSFATRSEFVELVRKCIGRSNDSLQLFDPDFAMWSLGTPETISVLRHFLMVKSTNRLQLSMHRTNYLQQSCPRFLSLLGNFNHAIECRVTPKNLQNLPDSFCLADNAHLVRRFHSDHFRGKASFDSPTDTQISSERFTAIWIESLPGLHATILGL